MVYGDFEWFWDGFMVVGAVYGVGRVVPGCCWRSRRWWAGGQQWWDGGLTVVSNTLHVVDGVSWLVKDGQGKDNGKSWENVGYHCRGICLFGGK